MSFTHGAFNWFTCFCAISFMACIFRRRRPAPYPPGPKGLPFVGNVLDMPSIHIWRTFTEWGRKYGDIVHVNALRQHVVILNSAKQATSMLSEKSNIYSDRPTPVMGGELVGWNEGLGMMPYGPAFREQRRYMHSSIGSKTSTMKHYVVLLDEQRKFLKRVLQNDEDIGVSIRRTATAIALRIAYGYDVQGDNDQMVTIVDKAVDSIDVATTPGLWLVDSLPFLRYLPTWFPGTGFKMVAAELRKLLLDMVDVPYAFTKQKLAQNAQLSPNFVADHIRKGEVSPEVEHAVKWAAASIYAGGSDTVVSAMHSFILAMTLYPGVQKRARAELDVVVGDERLPCFEDRERLPFIEAIVKETLRWKCPAPHSLPHRSTDDDIHDGYFIPKGTTVLANIWAILHDPETYPDPDTFDPSRFVTASGESTGVADPYDVCFGYGRRRCPGVNFVDASLFLWCAMTLAVYDISQAKGPDGKFLKPICEYTSSAIIHIKPFHYSIAPRSDRAKGLILSIAREDEK